MNRYILICLLFLIPICKFGQAFNWAKKIGGTNYDVSNSIEMDLLNNVYITGSFNGMVDFDPNAGIKDLFSYGLGDAFITKLDANGNLLWALNIGGDSLVTGKVVATDYLGNVFITGTYMGKVDFDPGVSTYTLYSHVNETFILKLTPSGEFVWVKKFDGTLESYPNSIAVDQSGNIVITGYYSGTIDFDPSINTYSLSSQASSADIFITKLDGSGNFIWAKSFGSPAADAGWATTTNSLGEVFATGHFKETIDFDPSINTFNLTDAGGGDIFVLKLDASGNFNWAKRIGGTSTDYGLSIFLDQSENVYTTGWFTGTSDFDPGLNTYSLTSAGMNDIFVTKFDSNGNFIWAKNFGGPANDNGTSIYVDNLGLSYVVGWFAGLADFNPDINSFNLQSNGSTDAFILKLGINGDFLWAKNIGSIGNDACNSIVVDESGNVYTTGSFNSTVDFDIESNIFNLTSNGNYDCFIHKMNLNSVGTKENFKSSDLTIFPNPNYGSFIIQTENNLINCELFLINSMGQKVYQQKVTPGKNQIITNELPVGLYNCILMQNNLKINSSKLIIE